ncbi:MAG: hypothetical protein ACYS7Y_29890 [Planctomycetota bacterium]|jgi:hypothetical protein
MGFEKQVESIAEVVEKHHVNRGDGYCKECGDEWPCDCVALVEIIKALLSRCMMYCNAIDMTSAQLTHMSALMQRDNIANCRSIGQRKGPIDLSKVGGNNDTN